MKANNIDDFISSLKDFYFHVFAEDFFPDVTREEFNKAFDEVIKIRSIK